MRSRLVAPKEVTGTAHKLARIFYHLWKTENQYKDIGNDSYEQKYEERFLKNMKRKAEKLGHIMTLAPTTNENVS
jgi:D-alanyl-D-alanine carboxypeptidase